MRLALLSAVMLTIAACTELRPAGDLNRADLPDSAQPRDGTVVQGDASTEPRDAELTDRGLNDRGLRDGQVIEDGEVIEDSGAGEDAEAGDDGVVDAGDTGVPECVPLAGQPCAASQTCGATYDCFGNCTGGTEAPPCECSTLVCDLVTNRWSTCNDPMTLGDSCDTANSCGGQIDCAGNCAGGSPMPVCQCGTPTCGGCTGGTCGANSTCMNGQCVCTVDECQMDGTTYCWQASLQTCAVDAYSCGDLTLTTMCGFGCVDFELSCGCSPNLGQYCSVGICHCGCGDFDREGEIVCDGSCDPFIGCPGICRDACGPVGPDP